MKYFEFFKFEFWPKLKTETEPRNQLFDFFLRFSLMVSWFDSTFKNLNGLVLTLSNWTEPLPIVTWWWWWRQKTRKRGGEVEKKRWLSSHSHPLYLQTLNHSCQKGKNRKAQLSVPTTSSFAFSLAWRFTWRNSFVEFSLPLSKRATLLHFGIWVIYFAEGFFYLRVNQFPNGFFTYMEFCLPNYECCWVGQAQDFSRSSVVGLNPTIRKYFLLEISSLVLGFLNVKSCCVPCVKMAR